MEVISIKNLSKSYKVYKNKQDRLKEAFIPKKTYHTEFKALKNISISINQGEIVGIVGRNGAGKSTLLKLITGVIQPTKGSISTKGKITAILELAAGFNPEFTGRENIKFFCDLMEISDEEAKKLEKEIIEFSELGDFIDRPLKHYSSGMRSKFAFSVNTNIDPDILILDEVLSVGDEVFKRKSFMKMEKLLKSGKTVLFVTHNLKSVREICSRAIILDKGEAIFDGSSEDAITKYQTMTNAPTPKVYNEIREKIKAGIPLTEEENGNVDFNPEFQSKAKQTHKYFDLDVNDIQIYNLDGKEVNKLSTNEKYQLKYTIVSHIDVKNLRTRFNFKTSTNIPISAAISDPEGTPLADIKKGETIHITWEFDCNFLKGEYFGNIALLGDLEKERTLLVRIVDAFAFKVEKEDHFKNYSDTVFMNQNIKINKTMENYEQA